VGFYYRIAARH